jgi:hypothetical protein
MPETDILTGKRCDKSKLETLRVEMVLLARQLRRWAVESREGGWSTHQVGPMRRKADEIDEILERNS